MTVNSTVRTAGPFAGTGAILSAAPFTFKVFAASDIVAQKTDALGGVTMLVLTTDYTVALNPDQDVAPGGSITTTAALAVGASISLTSNVPATQLQDITNSGGFLPSVINGALDKLTILLQQVTTSIGLFIKFPLSDIGTVQQTLPAAAARANRSLVFDSSGNPIVSLDNYTDNAAAAAASASAAHADRLLADADVVLTHADVVITHADASTATAAAAAAVAAATSVPFRDVVFKTFADSPYTPVQVDDGKLFSIDTSGGNFVINLPSIAGLAMPYNLSSKKTSTDANTVTMNRNGSDTIDGNTSKTLTGVNQATTLIADTDPSPDRWTSADFGTSYSDPLTTKGDILTRSGSTTVRQGIGADNTIPVADSSQANGWIWKALSAILPSGSVLARSSRLTAFSGAITAITAAIPVDNTPPQITEGTEVFSISYTPTNAASILRISGKITGNSSANASIVLALFKAGATNCIKTQAYFNINDGAVYFVFEDIAGGTSAITYALRGGTSTGTYTLNAYFGSTIFFGSTTESYMLIEEIKP